MSDAQRSQESSREDCRDACNDLTECEYFNFDSKKSECFLYKIQYSKAATFVSGEKNCKGKIYAILRTIKYFIENTKKNLV